MRPQAPSSGRPELSDAQDTIANRDIPRIVPTPRPVFHAIVNDSNLPRDSAGIEGTQVTDRIPPPPADEQASETHLLLSSLDLALGFIARAHRCGDRERRTQLLTQAVESYGSVKGLLPKLALRPEQMALVGQRLRAVQECLRATPPIPTDEPVSQ